MKPLTARQHEVFSFISGYIEENSFAPTIREIASSFSISVKGAYDHVLALRNKEYIHYDGGRSRAIVPIVPLSDKEEEKTNEQVREIPIMGEVAAGKPILSEEYNDGTVAVPWSALKAGKQYFAMRIQGDSMVGAGIMPSDIVVIEKTEQVYNNDIVLAVLDERVTIKRFLRESSRICLRAENPEYAPIYCQNPRVIGKLAYLVRNYC